MTIFDALLLKLFPLYTIVFLGWFAGKYLDVKKESIAPLLIYIIAPVVIFIGVATTPINFALLSLPVLFFILACFFCAAFYFIGGFIWNGSEKNILAFTAGTGNTGYFGIPIVLALFGDEFLGIAVLSTLGLILYENSLGFYIAAKGNHTAGEALVKVLKLPALYAFFVGLAVNIAHIELSSLVLNTVASFLGAYIVLGMMLIGLGLSQVTQTSIDYTFTGISFVAKFLAWPIIIGLIIFFDMSLLHLYNPASYKVMLLMSIVPLAANTVAYATALNVHPEKAAVSVLLSTLFALVYIPLFIVLFFGFI